MTSEVSLLLQPFQRFLFGSFLLSFFLGFSGLASVGFREVGGILLTHNGASLSMPMTRLFPFSLSFSRGF